MKRRMLLLGAVLLMTSSIPITQANAAGAGVMAHLPLPAELYLSDKLTPVYDSPGGNKLYDAAPQFVKVTGAEDDWDYKLQKENANVWFEIQTSGGRRWVSLHNPQFSDHYYNDVLLTGDETIYADRSMNGRSLGTISKQMVRAIYADHGDYLVRTWLGYKWIHPVHSAYEHAHEFYGPTSISLRSITPMFASPDAGGPVVGWLSPQYVNSSLTLNNEWYNIDTWLGSLWVNPNIGYPQDLRKEDTSLNLTSTTTVYEHPNKKARVLGVLAPQTVAVFERGSGWHHIHSDWLGDAWIYSADPETDPDVYIPPAHIAVKPIAADWIAQKYDFGAGWSGYPFATEVYAAGSGSDNPSGVILPGEPINIKFNVANASGDDLTLAASTSFEIDILHIDSNSQNEPQIVWSGKLPPLTASFAKAERYIYSRELSFTWDQKDSDGKQVPFGNYRVQLKTPTNIDYTKSSSSDLLQQKAEASMRTSMWLTIGAP
jgi:hypothetical protein